MILMMAALTLVGGCKSSDDDPDHKENPFGGQNETNYVVQSTNGTPNWSVDWTDNDPIPSWGEVNTQNYETWAIYMIKLEDELAQYASIDDMMAVFVDGELRAFANPAVEPGKNTLEQDVFFLLKVYGNENEHKDIKLDVKYYSTKLQHLFFVRTTLSFESEKIYGVDNDLNLKVSLGASKYPFMGTIWINRTPAENNPVKLNHNDIIAAFVGDECRGCAYLDDNMIENNCLEVSVFLKEQGEKVTLRYFSSEESKIFTFKETIQPNGFLSNSINATF